MIGAEALDVHAAHPTSESRSRLSLARAAWLADGSLIVACRPRATERAGPPAPGVIRAGAISLGEAGGGERLLLARLPVNALERGSQGLELATEDFDVVAGGRDARAALTDLKTFVRDHLVGLEADSRTRLLASLAAAAAEGQGLTAPLAEGLYTVREALRERRPLTVVEARGERGVQVEELHRVDDDQFYVRGGLWESAPPVATLTAVSPEGGLAELLPRAVVRCRDPGQLGAGEAATFVCHFHSSAPSRRRDGWVFELANAEGRGVETAVSLSSTEPAAARDAIAADAAAEGPWGEAVRAGHVRPALTRLQELRRDSVEVAAVETHGAVPDQAETSIVVPLFGRIDLVEHQMAQFADDPEMRMCELIYVLDSPEDAEHLSRFSAELERLYGLPFRTVTLSGNGGVGLARNLGASLASGRRLLMLDSDVLPARPGWLGRLSAFLDTRPAAGAVAPKLLHEDEAVQSAGLGLEREGEAGEWSLEHRMKGVHSSLPAANVPGRVPAVTGACLLTDAELYTQLGGMSWLYLQGDYEDADFCLRLAAEGRESWYVPEVELYHLEAQSYSSYARAANRRYNRWLFTQLWGDAVPGAE